MSDTRSSNGSTDAGSGRRSLPARIGHYRVLGELGRGGMGTVYRAHEDSLNRDVAIKVLADHLIDDEVVAARFLREARTVAGISHPNLIHVYYTGSEDGQPFFVMEFVQGESLADMIEREQQLSPQRAAELLRQAASGLAAAHDRGLVHRDIKPSNLMLDRAGTLKVTDFGIALGRDFKEKLTTTGQFVGTSGYVSPEACKGQAVDARSDIFSLGIVLYEMLAGRMPFSGDSPLAMLVQVVEQPVPDVRELNPDVDGGLLRILDRMIEKKPEDRYQTCHELLGDVDVWLAETLGAVKRPAPKTETLHHAAVTKSRRQWPLAVLVLALVLFAAGGSAWLLLPHVLERRDAGPATAALPPAATAEADTEAARLFGELPVAVQPTPGGPVSAQDEVTATPVSPASDGIDSAAAGVNPDRMASDVVAAAEPGARVGEDDSTTGDSTAPAETSATAAPAGTYPSDGGIAAAVTPAGIETTDPVSRQPLAVAAAPAIEPAPALPAIPRLAVIASGDPAIDGTIGQVISRALADGDYELMDVSFLPGAYHYVGEHGVDMAGLGELVRAEGGRVLVVASVTPIGAMPLEYYGRHSLLYTSRIELKGYDLDARRSIGGGWSGEVRYTDLNATAQAEAAAEPLAAALAEAVRAYEL